MEIQFIAHHTSLWTDEGILSSDDDKGPELIGTLDVDSDDWDGYLKLSCEAERPTEEKEKIIRIELILDRESIAYLKGVIDTYLQHTEATIHPAK